RNSLERERISRTVAHKLLTQMLRYRSDLTAVRNLTAQAGNTLLESVLEKRFLEALRREHGGQRFQLKDKLVNGQHGYQVQAGDRRWQLELQVSLSEQDGVTVPCKPDFVFWPDDGEDDLPVAVFTDGWQYHKDIVTDDLAKRMAVAKSGRFSVWTLTWDDVDAARNGKDDDAPNGWSRLLEGGNAKAVVEKLCAAQSIGVWSDFHQRPPFTQLHQGLAGGRPEPLRCLASVLAIAMQGGEVDDGALQDFQQGAFWQRLGDYDLVPAGSDVRWGYRRWPKVMQWSAGLTPQQLTHWMSGDCAITSEPAVVAQWLPDSLSEDDLNTNWRQLWQCLNLLLPLRCLWAGHADMDGLAALKDSPLLHADAAQLGQDWQDALELADPAVQPWLQVLIQEGATAPETGYELLDDRGCFLAEAELAWAASGVAVCLEGCEADQSHFEKQGWAVFVVSDTQPPGQLLEKLKGI
ncbi:MAG: hypothetical protein L0H83_11735, partial [Salinisphaera sp.]|nr:hypothetical protein [Salinisphaera sp.]